MILLDKKSDNIGTIASTLCLIHCVATPFIFIVQSSSIACCSTTPAWWKFIDYFFLVISFLAVYRSTQLTTKKWMKLCLWLAWSILFFVLMNEKMSWLQLNENFIYVPALALIILHQYNRKYCQCNTTKCCADEK